MKSPNTMAKRLRCVLFVALIFGVSFLLASSTSAHANEGANFLYDDLSSEEGFATTSPWKSSSLTFGFLSETSDIAGTEEWQAIRDAMQVWATVSNLSFTEKNPAQAQINVLWTTGKHGFGFPGSSDDGSPFDGEANCAKETGSVLAHAFYPEIGDLHFDDDEKWTLESAEACKQPIDLKTVALHELGHSLGLQHVEDPESIMYPYYLGTRRYLAIDDILGIQSLYGYSTGLFHLRYANTTGPPNSTFRYGTVLGSRSVIGDWDGDGDQTIGIFHPPEKDFYLRNSNNPGAAEIEFEYGASEDLPVAGDWDGDGDQTVGVFRPSNGKFYLNDENANNPGDYEFQFGTTGDIPVAGDWNGDGVDSVGVYRPSKKTFFLKNKNTGSEADYTFEYGTITSLRPIVGDWDDDGDVTIGVYDPADGDWYLRNSNNAGAAEIELEYGDGGDVNPISGDWDGDGRTTVGLYQNG